MVPTLSNLHSRALLGLLLASASMAATFTATGAIQQYTVSTSGTYQIIAAGGQGGRSGGLGATVQGDLFLVAGSVLDIVVGSQGGEFFNFGAGGGGGSFVYENQLGVLTLYAAAGGGGGSSFNTSGEGGVTGTSGSNGGLVGGVNGLGGAAAGVGSGGGGAGWLGAGASGSGANTGVGGSTSPTFAAVGGAGGVGAFGGGGGGGGRGGGGGGGYSGGGAGVFQGAGEQGGGGGSYLSSLIVNPILSAGVNPGAGSVQINFLTPGPEPVPEPASALLLCAGLLGLAARFRKRVL